MNSNNFMTCYIHKIMFANPCQIWSQVLEIERQNTSQRTKKNAQLMSMSLFASLGNHCMKLDSFKVPLSTCIKATHSKFNQSTFHFYKCFYKYGLAKESLAKRISKDQRATTNMKCVRVFFEHCYCLAFFLKRFIFAS